MGIGDIISNSFKYPLGDKENFKYVAALFLLVGLTVAGIVTLVEAAIFFNNNDLLALVGIVALIGSLLLFIVYLIAPGYLVSVMREGIDQTGVVPKLDIVKNVVDTIKLAIISFIYMIIPGIIYGIGLALIIMGGMGSSSDSGGIFAILGLVVLFIALIAGIVFAILLIVAEMRFAKYDSMSAAISFSEVWEDLKQIGILKLIIVVIVLEIIASIILGIGMLIAGIPVIGGLVFGALILPFVLLAYSYALGTVYSEVA